MENKDVIITYENLYDILRREKIRAELQKLNDSFFQEVLDYLINKQAILESQEKKDNIFASSEVEKTRIQLKNVKKIIKDLYEKRETKIIQQAILSSRNNNSGYDLSAMLPEEQALFNNLLKNLNNFRSKILENLLKYNLPQVKKPKTLKRGSENEDIKKPIVKVLNDIPEFVGPDLNTYGPYKKNDEVVLPEDVAKHLVENKQAEAIK